MASKKIRPRGRIGRKSVWFVIAASAFALVMSALTAYDDIAYQGLHTLSLVVMLIAFLGVIGAVLSSRYTQQDKLAVRKLEETTSDGRTIYQIAPSRFRDFVSVEPSTEPGRTPGAEPFCDRVGLESLKLIGRQRREVVRVAVVRNTYVDGDVIEALMQFPSLVVIDIQGCRVDPEAWSEFACFERLEYLAVHGAVDPQSQRELHYTLPEVKPIIEPALFIHSNADTV